MKDAFGGSFMLSIILTFFVIFICFMAAAINLSKTFRIKNTVINYIERYKSVDEDTIDKIDEYLRGIAYSYPEDTNPRVGRHCESQNGSLTNNGVCIVSMDNGSYYKVFAYIVMDFPLFNIGTLIPISGETKIINYSK